MAGVGMTVYKPREGSFEPAMVYLPLILFIGMGLVDSLVKFAQQRFVGNSDIALFSAILFLNAFISGIAVLIFYPRYYARFLKPATWGWGILLGGVNFGSVFFLVRTLNFISSEGNKIDSSVVFGLNNLGIVGLSVMAGLFAFREKLIPVNWLGITLSLIAILLFAFG
jgi:multidrug transporter EmrE-like cation transporter